jgi:hypothetical protein
VKQHEKITQDYFAMKSRQQEIQQMNKNLHNEIKILKNDSAKAHKYYQNLLNQLVEKFVGYVKTHGGFIPSLQSASLDYSAGGQSMRRMSVAGGSFAGVGGALNSARGVGGIAGHEVTVIEQSLDETDALILEDDGSLPIDPSMDDSDQVSGLPSIAISSPSVGGNGLVNANASGKLKKFASMLSTGASGKTTTNASTATPSGGSGMLSALQQLSSNSRPGSGSRSTPISGSRPGSAAGHRSTLAIIPNSASSPSISAKLMSPNHRILAVQIAGIEIELNGATPTVDAFMQRLQSAVPQKAYELKYYEENNLKYDLINNNIQVFYTGLVTSLTQCGYWRKHSDDLTISMHQQKVSFEEHIQQLKAQHMDESLKAQAAFDEIRKDLKQKIHKRDIDIVGYKQLIATKDFQIAEREDAYRVMSDHFDRYRIHTEASLELWRSRTRMLTADGWLGERVDRLENTKKVLTNELEETNKVVQHQQETIQGKEHLLLL